MFNRICCVCYPNTHMKSTLYLHSISPNKDFNEFTNQICVHLLGIDRYRSTIDIYRLYAWRLLVLSLRNRYNYIIHLKDIDLNRYNYNYFISGKIFDKHKFYKNEFLH